MNEQIEQEKNIQEETDIKRENPKWDFLLKIISVFLAILIWFWVVGVESQVTQRKFKEIIINLENVNEMRERYGYSVLSDKDIKVEVVLEGKNSVLNRIKPTDIYAYIDLKEVAQAGDIALMIKVRDIDFDVKYELSQNYVTIPIDKLTLKSIEIKGFTDEIKDIGIEIDDLIFEPKEVTVSGPAKVVDTISHAEIYLSLGRIDNDSTSRTATATNIILIDNNNDEIKNQYIKTVENEIKVTIPIYTTKEVPLKVDYKYGFYNDNNVKVSIKPSTVTIKGSPYDLNKINEVFIGVVDEKQHTRGIVNNPFEIPLILSKNIKISLSEPVYNLSGLTEAEVDVALIDTDTKIITVKTSATQNANFKIIPHDYFSYRITEENINIILYGPSENLKRINASGITLTADLSYISSAGLQSVPLVIKAFDDAVYCIDDYYVNVEIS